MTLIDIKVRLQEAYNYINENSQISGDDGDKSELHNQMDTLGNQWGVSVLTGLGRSVYAVAKMATRIALAALCFVCAITLGCFGKGGLCSKKIQYNLDKFEGGTAHLRKGLKEIFQLSARAESTRKKTEQESCNKERTD